MELLLIFIVGPIVIVIIEIVSYFLLHTKPGECISALLTLPAVLWLGSMALAAYPFVVAKNHIINNWLKPAYFSILELSNFRTPKFDSVRFFSGVAAFLTFGLGKSIYEMMTGNGDLVYEKKEKALIAKITEKVSTKIEPNTNTNTNPDLKPNLKSDIDVDIENLQIIGDSNSQFSNNDKVTAESTQKNNPTSKILSPDEILHNSYARFNEVNRQIQTINPELLSTGKPMTLCRKLSKGIKSTFGIQRSQHHTLSTLLNGYNHYIIKKHRVVTLDEFLATIKARDTRDYVNEDLLCRQSLEADEKVSRGIEKVITALKSRPS